MDLCPLPLSYFRAIIATDGDDARASARVILAVLVTSALGTAIAAPFIEEGLASLALVTAMLTLSAVLVLLFLPPLVETQPQT